ncbi:MAG: cytochrome c [Myxococcales bacterium]|nr:cytochrome c [Myxococcales bacterium]
MRLSILLLGAVWLLAGPALADQHKVADEHPGYPYYLRYCGACHGVFGDGLGPAVPALRSRPPDLTRLGEKYGLPLPKAAIRDVVDGELMVRAHGKSDMPIWGRELRRGAVSSIPKAPQILNVIVDYLEAIQREPAAE